jgi:hypothetical protein
VCVVFLDNEKNCKRRMSIFERKILLRMYNPKESAVREEMQQRIRICLQ